MSFARSLGLWQSRVFFSGVILLAFTTAASADPKPLSKEEQAKVDKAIDKAIAYLKRTQGEDGDWANEEKDAFLRYYSVGQCLLAAYALLEAGVPPGDPVIKKAAAYIRPKLLKTDKTYELSLGVLFLDRLGDAKDRRLIRSLALRLIAGQYRSGGWAYLCPQVKQEDEEALIRLLGEANKLAEAREKPSVKWLKELDLPRTWQSLAVFHASKRLAWRDPILLPKDRASAEQSLAWVNSGGTDNSNTQFAMLALWAAGRYKLPLRPTFDLLVLRFESSQGIHGEWSYQYQIPTHYSPDDLRTFRGGDSMTCVGLIALAIGRALRATSSVESPAGKLPLTQHESSTGKSKSAPLGKTASQDKNIRILKGLGNLYRGFGFPTGQMDQRVPLRDYYFLWSLERVAMLYNLPTLADKEWYRWGAEVLITNQDSDGSFPRWLKHRDNETLNTAFALLFLKRSHPMKDLTPKLALKPDELNENISRIVSKGKGSDRSIVSPGQSQSLEKSIAPPSQNRSLEKSITSPGKGQSPHR